MVSVGQAYAAENRERLQRLRENQNKRSNGCIGTGPYPVDLCDDEKYSFVWKVVLIGDAFVGKSSLCYRYFHNSFKLQSSIWVQFYTREMQLNEKTIKMAAWDTSGEERFLSVTRGGAVGALLVYDISKRKSFESLERWLKELRDQAEDDTVIVLVGNKCDLEHLREVSLDEAKSFADKNDLLFIETSALDSTNVDAAFLKLVNEIHTRVLEKEREDNKDKGIHTVTINTTNESLSPKESYCTIV